MEVEAPIVAHEEIVDNRLVLEAIVTEMCDLLNLYDTPMHINRLFLQACSDPIIHHVMTKMEDSDSLLEPRWYDLDYAWHWMHTPKLPSDIRKQVLEMHIRLDDLSEYVAEMSQTRWERLAHWSSQHV